MKRSTRQLVAQETVAIVQQGEYAVGDETVRLAHAVKACLAATRYYPEGELPPLCDAILASPNPGYATTIHVRHETTLAGVASLFDDGHVPVAALNFASARNPGGGFLNGSQAQEESLARSSALYASLREAPTYYDRHRAMTSCLYSDAMIVSPDCPIIRDDQGRLLPVPRLATFITSPAPNASAIRENAPHELVEIPDTFHRRARCVLAAAIASGCEHLVLGAWGCGVFGNDPGLVASTFATLLRSPEWQGRFRRVVFSIFDASRDQSVLHAFQRSFPLTSGD